MNRRRCGESGCPAGQSAQDDTIQLAAATYSIAGAADENANASGDFDITFNGGTEGFLKIDGVLDANGVPQTVIDAVSHLGVTAIEKPASPERVWRAIQEAKNSQGGAA